MRSQYPPMSPGFAPRQADPIVDATDFPPISAVNRSAMLVQVSVPA